MKQHYVYITTNLINGKQYVGDHTINPKEKIYYLGSGNALSRAIKKYKPENFFKEILEWFDTREESFTAQEKYISFYKTHISQGGYNISWKGGYGKTALGKIPSKESLLKRSNSMKGKNKGKIMSEEQKKKLSLAHKGKKLSEKHKLKMKGKIPWNKNKKLSPETIFKLSESHKGHKHSKETKQKISKNYKGFKNKQHTIESKEKNRVAHLNKVPWNFGKTLSEEHRKNLSISHTKTL